MRATISTCAIVLMLLLHPSSSIAQTNPNLAIGLTPYQSYDAGNVDSVSLLNGNLYVHIPLVSYPQRGSLNFGYAITYNDKNWYVWQICNDKQNPCTLQWRYFSPQLGGIYVGPEPTTSVTYAPLIPHQASATIFTAHMTDGASHLMMPDNAGGYHSVDGSGIWYNGGVAPPTGTGVYITKTRDGITFQSGASGTFTEDPNGNYSDSLGRTTSQTSTSDYSGCVAPAPPAQISAAIILSLPGQNGSTRNIKICSASYNISFDSGGILTTDANGFSHTISPGSETTTQNVSVVSYNGSSWANSQAWGFNFSGTGSLSQITFPTGGTISYAWTGVQVCPVYAGLTPIGMGVYQRTINAQDGTGAHTTGYGYGANFGQGLSGTLVTDANANDTVHIFGDLDGNCSLYETQTKYYAGSFSTGTLQKTVITDYTSTRNPFGANMTPPSAINVLPIRKTTIWPNGQTAKVETVPDSNFKSGSYSFSYGDALSVSEYDYGNGSPGALLRTTTNTYLPFTNSSYLSANLLDLGSSSIITNGSGAQVSKTTYAYDGPSLQSGGITTQRNTAFNTTAPGIRGNRTSVCRWLNTTGANLCTSNVFYDTGMPYTTTDPNGNKTTFAFSPTYAGAYLTQTTLPATGTVQHVTSATYDYNTGELITLTDQNNQVSTFTYDAYGRLASAAKPDGGVDTITHQETSTPFTATLSTQINTNTSKTETNVFDGFGAVTQHQLTSDPQGAVYTDTTYDALRRVAIVSNPHRACGVDPTSSCGITTYSYDALGRKISESYPDGSVLQTAYCGPSTLVTDPTKRWRRSRTDGLGHLVEVDEPNAIGATVAPTGCPGTGEAIWVTNYTLDALGNLTSALQNGSRPRSFTYDSLSRLLTSTNPEVGTLTYTYDADGNVQTKKDARAITTTYGYDALNRELTRTYSNGDPTVTTSYDQSACLGLPACQNIGHRTSMTDAAGSEAWAYEVAKAQYPNWPNIEVDQRTTSGVTKTGTYYADLAGNIIIFGYPTGRTVIDVISAANRIDEVYNGPAYAISQFPASPGCPNNQVCYTPQGTIYSMALYENSSFNGLNILETYNARLQPQEIKVSSTGGNAMDITYNYTDPVNGGNAGHVFSITNNLNNSRTQNFTYDQLNRITSAGTFATTGGYCWGYQYTYDAWANLTSQSGWTPNYNGCTETVMAPVTADGNNHISSFSYDAAGNATGETGFAYTWDAESQLKTDGTFTFGYDGDGRRVSGVALFWYGPNGEILGTTDGSGTVQSEYVYLGSRRLEAISGTEIRIYASDSLGSARIITDNTGAVYYDADFTPYGGERAYTDSYPTLFKFEGKERDTESGNDDFGARYYSNRFGRWLSADWSAVPLPVPYANLSNPQTLNLYSMVADDPESFADLDGHDDCCSFWQVVNFLAGAANAYGSDNLAGAGRQQQTTTEGKIGAAAGDTVAAVQGVVEVVAGGGGEAGGVALDATGVGAVVGVPLNVASAVVIAHGATTATEGVAHLGAAAGDAINGAMESRRTNDFTSSGKKTIDADNAAKNGGKNVCENCGTETQPGKKSEKGVRPPDNERQRDHIKPASQGGTNDPKTNGQVLCRKCNLDKSDKTPQ
jgi:RHS repeat-associated protein